MHKEQELILFSGGVDSTILLESFLKEKRNVAVLYNQLGYNLSTQPRIPLQNETVTKILTYFKQQGYDFEYINAGLYLNIPARKPGSGGTDTDDQYNALLAGMVCRALNIKKIYSGIFTYTDINRIKMLSENSFWYFSGEMEEFIQYGTGNHPYYKDIKYLTPMHKEIPEFLKKLDNRLSSKKEAFNYLNPELRKLVRSCNTELFFCGNCYKCQTYIEHDIKNKEGIIL